MMRKQLFQAILWLVLPLQAALGATVTLKWDPNPAGDTVTSYSVYQATGSGGFTKIQNVLGTVTTASILNVSPGLYRFYVTASNQWGESTPSNTVQTPGTVPTPPGSLILTIAVRILPGGQLTACKTFVPGPYPEPHLTLWGQARFPLHFRPLNILPC